MDIISEILELDDKAKEAIANAEKYSEKISNTGKEQCEKINAEALKKINAYRIMKNEQADKIISENAEREKAEAEKQIKQYETLFSKISPSMIYSQLTIW